MHNLTNNTVARATIPTDGKSPITIERTLGSMDIDLSSYSPPTSEDFSDLLSKITNLGADASLTASVEKLVNNAGASSNSQVVLSTIANQAKDYLFKLACEEYELEGDQLEAKEWTAKLDTIGDTQFLNIQAPPRTGN